MILIKLIFEFLKIGSFSFGSGLATLPFIFDMARRTSWITEDYINNILTLSQITPGPIACNIATIVGYNVAGLPGAVVANIAFVFPASLVMGICFRFVEKIKNNKKANEVVKSLRAASLALLITSSYSIFQKAFLNESVSFDLKNIFYILNYKSLLLGICVFIIVKKSKINFIITILLSILVAGILRI